MNRALAAAAVLFMAALPGGLRAQEPGRTSRLGVALDFSGPPEFRASLERALAASDRVRSVSLADDGPSAAARGDELFASVRVELLDSEAAGQAMSLARRSWTISASRSDTLLAKGEDEGSLPSSRDLMDSYWIPLVADVENVDPAPSVLKVKGPPGAVVRGLGKEPLVLDDEGKAVFRFDPPDLFVWDSSARGYLPESGIVAAAGAEAELVLPARKVRDWSIETGLRSGAFPDIRATRTFFGDVLFARAGIAQYAAGLALRDARPFREDSYFRGEALVEPGLGAGVKAFDQRSELRPYAALDVALRIFLAEGVDSQAPLRLVATAGSEWRLARSFLAFLEIGIDFYPGAREDAMGTDESTSPGLRRQTDAGVVDFPALRFGLRWEF